MRDKYSNKTPKMRFFHKYTGVIVLSIILIGIAIGWGYYETTKVFFENWSCDQIFNMIVENTTLDEFVRFQEIVRECQGEEFTP